MARKRLAPSSVRYLARLEEYGQELRARRAKEELDEAATRTESRRVLRSDDPFQRMCREARSVGCKGT